MSVHQGDWVSDGRRRGIVTSVKPYRATVRWLGTQKGASHAKKTLRTASAPRALVLEGNLDGALHSTRSGEMFLRNWFESIKVPLAYKTIHSLSDLPVIGAAVGSNKPLFLHISCHGGHDDKGGAVVRFSPGKKTNAALIRLNHPDTHRVFRDYFAGMPVLFSACDLGRYENEMIRFREGGNLASVAAFSRTVGDSETMLFEILLYHGMLHNTWKFETAITRAVESLKSLDIRGGLGKGQALVRLF